jgi:hypothetical protein
MSVHAGVADEYDRQLKGLPGFMRREAAHAGELTTRHVAQLTPIGKQIDPATGDHTGGYSGKLRKSWRTMTVRVEGTSYTSGTSSSVSYAGIVDGGARAHVIEGNRYLRFFTHGELLVRERVHHPGFRGIHMTIRGLNAAEREFLEGAGERYQRFLDGGE